MDKQVERIADALENLVSRLDQVVTRLDEIAANSNYNNSIVDNLTDISNNIVDLHVRNIKNENRM